MESGNVETFRASLETVNIFLLCQGGEITTHTHYFFMSEISTEAVAKAHSQLESHLREMIA